MKYWSELVVDTDTFQRGAYGVEFTCICGDDNGTALDPYDAFFHDEDICVCTKCNRRYRMRVIVDVRQEYTVPSPEIVSAERPETVLEEERVLNRHFRQLLDRLAEHLPYTAKYSQVVQEAIRIIDAQGK